MSVDYDFLTEPLTENPDNSKSPDIFQIKAITKKIMQLFPLAQVLEKLMSLLCVMLFTYDR